MARRDQSNPFSNLSTLDTRTRGFNESVAVSPREQARVVASLTAYAAQMGARARDTKLSATERRQAARERDNTVKVVNAVSSVSPNQRGGITLSGDVIELVDKADNFAAENGTGRFI